MGSVAIDQIGLLVTNNPDLGSGPLGTLSDVALIAEDRVVVAIEPAGSSQTDERIDASGRCVIPGFVDSHTHLVFAGDRSAEFAGRMAGAPYAAGGINVTREATVMASDDQLRLLLADRVAEARRAGITTIEIKSGYGLTVADEARLLRLAGEHTEETTFLGAHVVPAEYADRPDEYVDLVCGEMLDVCAPHARWIDVFCEDGAFDPHQSRRILEAGAERGLGLRVHGNQLGPSGGMQLAAAMGAASVDHCTFASDDDIEAVAAAGTVATLLPATEFSTRQPYPDARRFLEAGATIAIATNCNPGSSYTTSMSFCLALAVRDMHLTVEEALAAATLGGAAALRRTDIGHLTPGARADTVILDAPTPDHLVYRPGVPLIHNVSSLSPFDEV